MQKILQIRSLPFPFFERRTFFFLVGLFAVSSALYLYFISATILSIVARTTALNEAKILGTKISVLESEYMAFGNTFDLQNAKTLGYEEISKIDHLSRTASLGFAER